MLEAVRVGQRFRREHPNAPLGIGPDLEAQAPELLEEDELRRRVTGTALGSGHVEERLQPGEFREDALRIAVRMSVYLGDAFGRFELAVIGLVVDALDESELTSRGPGESADDF